MILILLFRVWYFVDLFILGVCLGIWVVCYDVWLVLPTFGVGVGYLFWRIAVIMGIASFGLFSFSRVGCRGFGFSVWVSLLVWC